ncbi:MAG: hypothetical protein L3K08_00795 [Thermoplasmata archaeon]|nr:hypothetical protein [Thermoplasmata archaeon]
MYPSEASYAIIPPTIGGGATVSLSRVQVRSRKTHVWFWTPPLFAF